jgi:hypothetical protein
LNDPVDVRRGDVADAPAVVALMDEAVTWLVQRGQTGQWGDQPFSQRPRGGRLVVDLAAAGSLRIAELAGETVAALIIGDAPDYVPPAARPELYIRLLVSSRRHAGRRLGDRLVQTAVVEAQAGRREQLRVDCWAGAPALVHWYVRQGFVTTEMLDLDGWPAQLFAMPLS